MTVIGNHYIWIATYGQFVIFINQYAMKNIFNSNTTAELYSRIDKLTATTEPQWGKMNVAQMLAHCCVPYEGIYDGKHQVSALKSFFIRLLLKRTLTNTKPYSKNSPTAPNFIIADERDFNKEKARLKTYIQRAEQDGVSFFEGKKSPSMGKLSAEEWSNMLYKHLDHHLTQFGV